MQITTSLAIGCSSLGYLASRYIFSDDSHTCAVKNDGLGNAAGKGCALISRAN